MKPSAIVVFGEESDVPEVTTVGDVRVVVIDWNEVECDLEKAQSALDKVSEIKNEMLATDPARTAIAKLQDRLTEIVEELEDEEDEDYVDSEEYDDEDEDEDY